MIKQIYVCECDICGAVEKAKLISSNTDEEDYGLPYTWCYGKNHDICICPECIKKLNAKSDTPKTNSQVVLDTAASEITEYNINKYLKGLKVYCSGQDSCETCPIAYFEEKTECWQCSLTNTPVYEWQDIANKLKDEHKLLAKPIEMIAKYCKDDMGDCEDCRYCRSYERCDLRLHNPTDWVIYEDSTKREVDYDETSGDTPPV